MSKKVRDVLKGLAITGAAVGGASVLQDADLVYAMEAEEALEEIAEGELTVNVEQNAVEQPQVQQEAQLTAELVTEQTAEEIDAAITIEQANLDNIEAEIIATENEATENIATEQNLIEAAQEQIEADEQEIVVANEQLTGLEGQISEATAVQTVINEAIDTENTAIAEAQAAKTEIDDQIADTNTQISTNQAAIDEKNDTIADINGQIEQKDTEIATATTQIAQTKENLITASSNKTEAENELGGLTADLLEDKALLAEKEELQVTSGYDEAEAGKIAAKFDELLDTASAQIINKYNMNPNSQISMTEYEMLRESAKELVKYYLIQNGDVAYADLEKVSIVYYKNSEGNLTSYQNAHFCVRYADAQGKLIEKYFDYATCDKQGQTMLKADKDDSTPDYTKNYGGINLLIKMPTYKIANNESTTEFMYVTDADYKAMSPADRAIYSKSATFNNVKYHYLARIGWAETDQVAVKGADIYTRAQYTADIDILKNLPEDIKSLKNIISQLKSDIADKQSLVESYQNEIDTYTQELSNETAARTALEQAKADIETQKQNLESEIAAINVVIGGLQNDVNLLTEQKTQLENEIIQHNNSIAEYQTQLDAKVAEIAGLQTQVDSINQQIATLQAEIVNQNSQISESLAAKDTIRAGADEKIAQLNIAKAEILARIAALEKRLNELLSMKPGEITNDVPVVSNQAANDVSSALASETALESEVEDAVAPSETVSIIDLLKQQPVIDYDDEEVEDDIISTLETEATTEAAVGENLFVPIQQQATISNEVVETESIEDARVPLAVNLENTEKSTTIVDSEVPLANDMIAPRLQWKGHTVPGMTMIAGLFAIGKIKKEKNDNKGISAQ